MKKYAVTFITALLAVLIFAGCGDASKATVKEYESNRNFKSVGTAGAYTYIAYDDYSEIIAYLPEKTENVINFPASLGGKPVRVLGGGLMSDSTNITSVTIPDSVIRIEDNCFDGCTKLESVELPETVKEIGCCAFYGTPWFENLQGEYVTVGDGVLIKYNGNGGDIKIPSNVKYISDAFAANNLITSVNIPNSVTGICDYAFYNCGSMTNVSLPETISDIGMMAFDGTSWILISDKNFVTVGNGVLIKYLGSDTDVTVPSDVKYISGAFSDNTDIVSVTIPASVRVLRPCTFAACTSLETVIFEGADTIIEDSCFYGCTFLKNVNIPANTEIIGNYTFFGCTSLKSIEIPEKVGYIGISAFKKCTGISEAVLPKALKAIGNSAFSGCRGLTGAELPESLSYLGEAAFSSCQKLCNVTLPESLTVLQSSVFSYCTSLTEITMSPMTVSVAKYAFENCTGIKIYVPGTHTSFEIEALYGCEDSAEIICRDGSEAGNFAEVNKIKYSFY